MNAYYDIIDEILYNDFNEKRYDLTIDCVEEPTTDFLGLIEFTVKSDEFPSYEAIRKIEQIFEEYIVETHYS